MKPRILILSTAYLPLVGGSELAIRHLTERLTDYDFDLVTGRYRPDMPVMEHMGRVRVFRAGGRWSRLTFLLPKNLMPVAIAVTAWRLALTRRYAVVHAYQASQAGGAAWLLKFLRPGLPLVVTLQEGNNLDRQPWLVRAFRSLILHRADRITAISTYLADYARLHSHAHVDLIPNGVTIREVSHRPQNPDPTVLTVSRLVPKNNVEGVIRAFALVCASVPNARLLVVGEGPLRAQLEALASELGVRDAVQFMGTVPHDDLPSVYAAADVFVRPSLSEGLGSVFLEAMAAGVPVVASGVGGIPDIVRDGDNGLIVDPSNAAAIAAATVRLITDAPLRERLSTVAGAMVRESYDWNAIARRMGEVYRQVSST